MKDCYIPQPK